MNCLTWIPLALIILISSCSEKVTEDASQELSSIIEEYEAHKGFDEDEFPLGLFTAEFYKEEAEYAKSKLEELSEINSEGLSETERISLKLLKFVLQDRIDYYEFERYLNPLLSDSGFHCDLTHLVHPLSNYEQVIEFLNKLHAIPGFVDQHVVNLRKCQLYDHHKKSHIL